MAGSKPGATLGVAQAMSDWFDIGWALYKDKRCDAHCFPPLGDRQAQRWWLGGFGAAWAAAHDETPLDLALASALIGRTALLEELRTHASAPSAGTLH